MKKRSFLEFGGLWSCRRVVIPKFSRVIICFFGIYRLLEAVGGNLSKKHRWKGQYFWNWHVGNELKGDAFPKNSVYSMEILELTHLITFFVAVGAEVAGHYLCKWLDSQKHGN